MFDPFRNNFFLESQRLSMMRKVGFGANALRGTTYSIRCVIRGARKSGKTQLANLLRGLPFVPQYNPTATLQSSEIDMDINGISFSYLNTFYVLYSCRWRRQSASPSLSYQSLFRSFDTYIYRFGMLLMFQR